MAEILESIKQQMDTSNLNNICSNLKPLPWEFITEKDRGCDHVNCWEDTHEGIFVCIDCGLVIEDRLQLNNYEQCIPARKSDIETFLTDICHNANLPSGIIPYTLWYLKSVKSRDDKKMFNEKQLAIFALYESLNRHDIPRTPQELEYYSGIKYTMLWKIENTLMLKTTLAKSENWIEKFCILLEIDFKHVYTLKNIVRNMFGFGGVQPQSLAALVIHLYCKEQHIPITLKKICEFCVVSTSAIAKLKKKMHTKFLNNISLLDA